MKGLYALGNSFYIKNDDRREYDDLLVSLYADCFECVPSIARFEPELTAREKSRNDHIRALIRSENRAKYRSLIATKEALMRREQHVQALRLAEHLDKHWGAYVAH